jgi:hypothetical protein
MPTFGGFGGPPPRDVIVLLGVLFVTFTLQFFRLTAALPAVLRLTPAVWQKAYVWQILTYPFVGHGRPDLWFLLELLILFWFGRDVYRQLGRRTFWRLSLLGSAGAAVVATSVNIVMVLAGTATPAPFLIMQGQRMLLVLFIAAFATLNAHATIYLMFVLPIRARWFLWLEILFAFLGFLATGDFAGFVAITFAVALVFGSLSPGGLRRAYLQARLKANQWYLRYRLERNRQKRNLRVIRGDKKGLPDDDSDRWIN